MFVSACSETDKRDSTCSLPSIFPLDPFRSILTRMDIHKNISNLFLGEKKAFWTDGPTAPLSITPLRSPPC